MIATLTCGPVDPPAPPVAPQNKCPEHSCSAYSSYAQGYPDAECNAGFCSVNANLDYLLTFSLPQSSALLPAQSVFLDSKDLFANADDECVVGACIRLKPFPTICRYDISPNVSYNEVKYYIGPAGATNTSLPIDVTYRPLWSALGTAAPVEAASVGLPLLAVHGVRGTDPAYQLGPYGVDTPISLITLPPGDYERTVMPVSPFDSAFPPDIQNIHLPPPAGEPQNPPAFLQSVDKTENPPPQPKSPPRFNVSRTGGELNGWFAYLRDVTNHRRISSLVQMQSNPQMVQLNTSHHPPDGDAMNNAEVVIEPPLGADALPSMVVSRLGGQPFSDVPYPSIPPPTIVSGTVAGGAGGVRAKISFSSSKIYLANSSAPYSKNLFYEKAVNTNSDGTYSVRLPKGEYAVTVSAYSSDFAKKDIDGFVVGVDSDSQTGRNFDMPPAVVARGKCVLGDGRPLADADVDFVPARKLLKSDLARERWPTGATVHTDLGGGFRANLDPGLYDIVVRPAPGSKLPWLVQTSITIDTNAPASTAGIDLGVFAIPAPIVIQYNVQDSAAPRHNPVTGALVRAYAVGSAGLPVEIGRTTTDENGHFALYVAGPPK